MKTIFLLCALSITLVAAENPISLNTQQRTKLMELIKTDNDAKARFESFKRAADKALDDKPNPIRVIQGEGKLKTDPVAIKTRESLADMRKMYFFAYTFAATGDTPYADKAREFILAWAQQNIPTGNPIDETTLDDLFFAFDMTQSQFSLIREKKVPKLGCARLLKLKSQFGTLLPGQWQYCAELSILAICTQRGPK